MAFYYMEESVLLGTKQLVDSIHHFIRVPSSVFSVCHLCDCHIVQWRHDSCLLLLLNWFLHIIKRTLHVGSKIWMLCSRGKNNICSLRSLVRYCSCRSNIKFISSHPCVISSMYVRVSKYFTFSALVCILLLYLEEWHHLQKFVNRLILLNWVCLPDLNFAKNVVYCW